MCSMSSKVNLQPPLQVGRFLVEIGNEVVANFQDCSGIAVEFEVQEVIEGGNNEFILKLPGRRKFTNITLKRGVTTNPQFMNWRPKVEGGKITVEKKNLSIILFSHTGDPVKRWNVVQAFPMKWTGPDLKASSMEVAIESLELAHEGWTEK
ncbi:MAG: phage tail protein [Thermomicrobiales bacterium]